MDTTMGVLAVFTNFETSRIRESLAMGFPLDSRPSLVTRWCVPRCPSFVCCRGIFMDQVVVPRRFHEN